MMERPSGASAAAKTHALQSLGDLALFDAGVEACLVAKVALTVLDALEAPSGDARTCPELRVAAARMLKHLAQDPRGKLIVFSRDGALQILAGLLRSRTTDLRAHAAGAFMGIAIEVQAKLPVWEAAGADLVMLLRDPSPLVAENAMYAIQNACEHPVAKRAAVQIMSEKDRALVFNMQVMVNNH